MSLWDQITKTNSFPKPSLEEKFQAQTLWDQMDQIKNGAQKPQICETCGNKLDPDINNIIGRWCDDVCADNFDGEPKKINSKKASNLPPLNVLWNHMCPLNIGHEIINEFYVRSRNGTYNEYTINTHKGWRKACIKNAKEFRDKGDVEKLKRTLRQAILLSLTIRRAKRQLRWGWDIYCTPVNNNEVIEKILETKKNTLHLIKSPATGYFVPKNGPNIHIIEEIL